MPILKVNDSFISCRLMPHYGLGLWCLTPLPTVVQLYHGSSDLLVKKTGVHTDLSQATDTFLSYTVVSSRPHHQRIRIHNISGDRH